jgi:hypothetical protein
MRLARLAGGSAAAALVFTMSMATPAFGQVNPEHEGGSSGPPKSTDPGADVLGAGASRSSSSSDTLPLTGGDVIAIAGIGAVAIGTGALAVSASRRRARLA